VKYFQETTDWGSDTALNHIYYLNDEKSFMVGYIKNGETELFKFKKPIRIDARGRQFKVLSMNGEPDSVYFGKPEEAPKQAIEFEGSNGKKYYVSKIGAKYICTCPGFTFRHTCKHVTETKDKDEKRTIQGDSTTSWR
jgi:hypothetical protein